ncbi:MAG: glycosyltransferase family 4 protein [Desulfonatronovibrionaceae bacterium]
MGKKIWASLDCFLEQGPVMGRKVANLEFIRALFRADPFDEYHFFPVSQKHFQGLLNWVEKNFPGIKKRLLAYSRLDLPDMLSRVEYHCFHLSDCINYPAAVARLRNKYSPRVFPVTSVIHSLSYSDYPAGFLRHLWPGTTARDCVVCTSRAGMGVVNSYFQALRRDYDLDDSFRSPVLRHIPLGLDWEKYSAVSAEARGRGRTDLGIADEDVCILILGRISYYSKMDFIPFMRSLSACLPRTGSGGTVHLVLSGGADKGGNICEALMNLAANAGISLQTVFDPSEDKKLDLLAAADIFASPADNYQETFGLTLLEAAASGLPVLASDFDGYRELVKNRETGFLVPTFGPEQSAVLNDLAFVLPDSHTHLLLAQNICLDTEEMADRLGELLDNPGLRLEMGQRGREKSKSYDWAKIINRYVTLWDELWDAEVDPETEKGPHPLGPDYARVFAGYPARILTDGQMLVWTDLGRSVYRKKDFPVVYAGMEGFAPVDNLRTLLFLSRNPISLQDLASRLWAAVPSLGEKAEYFVLWAVKQGYLRPVG